MARSMLLRLLMVLSADSQVAMGPDRVSCCTLLLPLSAAAIMWGASLGLLMVRDWILGAQVARQPRWSGTWNCSSAAVRLVRCCAMTG